MNVSDRARSGRRRVAPKPQITNCRRMAAPILSYEGLGLIQGEGWLFRGLDIYIGERDRLAQIGGNGAGKRPLLKCLAGRFDTDEGKRPLVPGTHVVLLEQDPPMTGFES